MEYPGGRVLLAISQQNALTIRHAVDLLTGAGSSEVPWYQETNCRVPQLPGRHVRELRHCLGSSTAQDSMEIFRTLETSHILLDIRDLRGKKKKKKTSLAPQ